MAPIIRDAGGLSGAGTTILIVVGTGGFTHAAPMLEIGRILAQRGHRIEFATHQGQERWLTSPNPREQDSKYSFISQVHLMGPGMDVATEVEHYMQMQESDARVDYRAYAAPKLRVDAFWESDYAALCRIITSGSGSTTKGTTTTTHHHHRPDLILADFFVDMAARDIQRQFDIPLASMWPQMPYGVLAGVPYIPGPPGLQIDALTSEHATLWTRVRAALRPFRALPTMLTYLGFLRSMRLRAGVSYLLPFTSKPNHLVLVNSFWGLETPRDLPPLVVPVGPVLADSYEDVEGELGAFLERKKRVLYVSFGTHVMVQYRDLEKLLLAMLVLLLPVDTPGLFLGEGDGKGTAMGMGARQTRYREPDPEVVYRESLSRLSSTSSPSSAPSGIIDGVVWAMTPAQTKLFYSNRPPPVNDAQRRLHEQQDLLLSRILANAHPQWHVVPFAPQRGVLAHRHTKLFLTHGGASSVQESIFHGTPMVCLGYFFDQPLNALRIREAGVGEGLDKADFSAGEVVEKMEDILGDGETGRAVARNVERMRSIARVASRRKELAADLCQEVLFDHKFGAAVGSLTTTATTADVLGDTLLDEGEEEEEEEADERSGDGDGGDEEPWVTRRASVNARTLEAGQHDPSSSSSLSASRSRTQRNKTPRRRHLHHSAHKDNMTKRRPMHLQTADMRMSTWRAQNWDLVFVGVVTATAIGGVGWFAWMRLGGHESHQPIWWW
ncbi:uncharacterized protein B0I36DRAFT_48252 [Microdochium trichocladiopsis]|uniref:UDP-glycosyltransferases domain-containing protein n=1 Tax=Microdochium trichocladiopsis TaxID=1682393 RepID=A0A9P8XUR8_9PEZI|nr:uncharacterized protein B0I36DRAFT_48252 [Microdochium trichocladiopsis]KAH7014128.1 hypothetical protein B0I36DRAFT_48252 [Microdochium trichocladiopsis]